MDAKAAQTGEEGGGGGVGGVISSTACTTELGPGGMEEAVDDIIGLHVVPELSWDFDSQLRKAQAR